MFTFNYSTKYKYHMLFFFLTLKFSEKKSKLLKTNVSKMGIYIDERGRGNVAFGKKFFRMLNS